MLLEELFVIKDINPGGKVFDRGKIDKQKKWRMLQD